MSDHSRRKDGPPTRADTPARFTDAVEGFYFCLRSSCRSPKSRKKENSPCGLSEKVVLCLLYRFYSSRLAQSQRRQPPPRCPELSPTALLTSLKSPRHGTALCF